MLLSEYLKSNDISHADFALKIGAKSRATIYRYINGDRKAPNRHLMEKILEATNGAVTANDFYNFPRMGHKKTSKKLKKPRSN